MILIAETLNWAEFFLNHVSLFSPSHKMEVKFDITSILAISKKTLFSKTIYNTAKIKQKLQLIFSEFWCFQSILLIFFQNKKKTYFLQLSIKHSLRKRSGLLEVVLRWIISAQRLVNRKIIANLYFSCCLLYNNVKRPRNT